MRRGDVLWAELAPRSGSEQGGRRPVILVSHDGFNQTPTWRSVIVVPLTTSVRQAGAPTSVALPEGAAHLPAPSVALCHQVTTLDRSKLGETLGCLTDYQVELVDAGLRASLAL